MRFLIATVLALAVYASEAAAQDWELVKADNLGFTVEFPGKPEFTETTGDDGGMIRTYVIRSSAAAYDVTIWDVPEGAVAPGGVNQFLDNFRDNNLAGITAILRTEDKIEIGGHPARNITADVMGMVWRGRIVVTGNRIYQIVAIVSKAAEASEETERYLNSFKLQGVTAKK